MISATSAAYIYVNNRSDVRTLYFSTDRAVVTNSSFKVKLNIIDSNTGAAVFTIFNYMASNSNSRRRLQSVSNIDITSTTLIHNQSNELYWMILVVPEVQQSFEPKTEVFVYPEDYESYSTSHQYAASFIFDSESEWECYNPGICGLQESREECKPQEEQGETVRICPGRRCPTSKEHGPLCNLCKPPFRPGNDAIMLPPPGYYSNDLCSDPAPCPVKERCSGLTFEEAMHVFGNGYATLETWDGCTLGYAGANCGKCAKRFYPVPLDSSGEVKCLPCSIGDDDMRDLTIAGLTFGIVFLIFVIGSAAASTFYLCFSVAIFLIVQQLAYIGKLATVVFPDPLFVSLFSFIGVANFEVGTTKPGCSVARIGFQAEFWGHIVLLVVGALLLVVSSYVRYCVRKIKQRIKTHTWNVPMENEVHSPLKQLHGSDKDTLWSLARKQVAIGATKQVNRPLLSFQNGWFCSRQWRKTARDHYNSSLQPLPPLDPGETWDPKHWLAVDALNKGWIAKYRAYQSIIILCFVLHLKLTTLALKGIACHEVVLNNVAYQVLNSDSDVTCWVGSHLPTGLFIIFFLVFYSVGFPLFCLNLVTHGVHDLDDIKRGSFGLRMRMYRLKNSETYGILFVDLNPRYFWYKISLLCLNLVHASLTVFNKDTIVTIYISGMIFCMDLGFLLYAAPFVQTQMWKNYMNRSLDVLKTMVACGVLMLVYWDVTDQGSKVMKKVGKETLGPMVFSFLVFFVCATVGVLLSRFVSSRPAKNYKDQLQKSLSTWKSKKNVFLSTGVMPESHHPPKVAREFVSPMSTKTIPDSPRILTPRTPLSSNGPLGCSELLLDNNSFVIDNTPRASSFSGLFHQSNEDQVFIIKVNGASDIAQASTRFDYAREDQNNRLEAKKRKRALTRQTNRGDLIVPISEGTNTVDSKAIQEAIVENHGQAGAVKQHFDDIKDQQMQKLKASLETRRTTSLGVDALEDKLKSQKVILPSIHLPSTVHRRDSC